MFLGVILASEKTNVSLEIAHHTPHCNLANSISISSEFLSLPYSVRNVIPDMGCLLRDFHWMFFVLTRMIFVKDFLSGRHDTFLPFSQFIMNEFMSETLFLLR